MADLDDFFAKRDKSKKSKKKFDTAEDLAKILDQKAKEKKKLETGKSNYQQEGGRTSPGPGLPSNDDDEWLEAEDKAPDFSNLKIQELVLESDEDEDHPREEGQEEGEGGGEGPWNKKKESKTKEGEKESPKEEAAAPEEAVKDKESEESSESKPQESEAEKTEESSKEAEKEDKPTSAYVPPRLRAQQQEADKPAPASASTPVAAAAAGAAPKGAYVPPSRRGLQGSSASTPLAPTVPKKKGAVPTLEDEESFPSLS